jgi:hypothetical protein
MNSKAISTKKGRKQNSGQETNSLLKELLVLQRQQLEYGLPNTRDIIFPTVRQKTYTFVTAYNVGNITASTTISTGYAYQFNLGSLPSASSFTALFDRYKIREINVQFNPVSTSAVVTGPPMTTVIDYDDATVSVNSELFQRDTAQQIPVGEYFERTFQPRIALAAYAGTFTGFANVAPPYMDVSSSGIQHYGLKVLLPAMSAAVNVYTVTARIRISFKNNL